MLLLLFLLKASIYTVLSCFTKGERSSFPTTLFAWRLPIEIFMKVECVDSCRRGQKDKRRAQNCSISNLHC